MVDHGRIKWTRGKHLVHIWFGGGCILKVRAFETGRWRRSGRWGEHISDQ